MNFRPNVVSFLVTLGYWRWYVVRVYMPLNNVHVVHCVEQALAVAQKYVDIILMGDLNTRFQ